MRPTFQILICCLYALSAVNATPFSKRGSAEVQQGNTNAAKPIKFWSDDKNDDDDKDDKWSKDGKDVKDNKEDHDECASRSVSVLIGTSTYAIPCLQGDSIVNLNGLIHTPTSSIASSSATEASSSTLSSSAVESSSAANSSSSEASSATDSTSTATYATTTTTDTITTSTTVITTTNAPDPNIVVALYDSSNCSGNVLTGSFNTGCFTCNIQQSTFSSATTSTTELEVDFYDNAACAGEPVLKTQLTSEACGQDNFPRTFHILSYSVTKV